MTGEVSGSEAGEAVVDARRLLELHGKNVVVTGGSSGIGFGIASGLASMGASVAILGRRQQANEDACRRIEAAFPGARMLPVSCDVGDESQVETAFEAVITAFGGVDSCFANAGTSSSRSDSFLAMTSQEWNECLRVNLDGTMFTLRAAARRMVNAGRGGSLVATSSIGALSGFPFNQHYAAAKAGVVALVRGLAVELARERIRCNAIVPGLVRSPMTKANAENLDRRLVPQIPLKRWGTPEDLAGLAVYLTADASAFHTGDVLVVDGGFSA